MSKLQWRRLDAVERVSRGELSSVEGARGLGLSERQMRRLLRRYEARGQAGLVHGNTGRVPPNIIAASVVSRVVELMQGRYAGCNDQHFTELLKEREGISLSRPSVQRILRSAHVAPQRSRRAVKLRKRRERKAQMGLMLLWDGSTHDWLEGRGPQMCLMGAIDDATGQLMPGAHFVLREGAAGYLRLLAEVVRAHGVPWSIYMDRHSSLKRNDNFWSDDEVSAGKQEATQVGQAMTELGIEAICALSPQAKGRVERMWGTLQDRLVSEMRLAKIGTMAEANKFLRRFIARFNARFAVTAQKTQPAWRSATGLDVDKICAFRSVAVVARNSTVQFAGQTLDIKAAHGVRVHDHVQIRWQLDGTLCVLDDNGAVLCQEKWAPPLKAPARRKACTRKAPVARPQAKPPRKNFKQIISKIRDLRQAA